MKTLISVLLLSALAYGQGVTLSPLNFEAGKRARGEFSITNGGFSPLPVTFEPMFIDLSTGKPELKDIPANVHIKLSSYSARIAAKQEYRIGFDLRCDDLPCTVIVFSTFGNGHINAGAGETAAVSAKMGFVIYSCQKEKGCRASQQARMK